MITFKQFLTERFINAFVADDKLQYADDVWEILQQSYKNIGGIKGSGFKSKQDMIDRIPFWKLGKRDGKIRAVVMYKDKSGRKSIAVGTDGTAEGKDLLKEIIQGDFKRSYGERSGPLLRFVEKHYPDLVDKYKIRVDKVKEMIPNIEPIDDYYYYRNIGGHKIKKMMMGTIGKTIK